MAKRDRPPAPLVRKTRRGISPVAAYDAELMLGDPMGTEYDLVKRNRRSLPQLRLYWSILHRVVNATGRWPSAEHLSDEIKLTLGYRRKVHDLATGEESVAVDSIAFANMDADEFRPFFDKAMALLSDALGFDPMGFYEGDPTPALTHGETV